MNIFFKNIFSVKKAIIVALAISLFFSSCVNKGQLNAYQKNTPVPGYEWDYDFKPSFSFEIKDTVARYTIYITLRHTNQYPFSNLWLMISSNYEGVKPKSKRVELPLSDSDGKWFGSGMGDIFEQRIPIQQNIRFNRIGTYYFELQQDMRINPLPQIMSVGLRVEKDTL